MLPQGIQALPVAPGNPHGKQGEVPNDIFPAEQNLLPGGAGTIPVGLDLEDAPRPGQKPQRPLENFLDCFEAVPGPKVGGHLAVHRRSNFVLAVGLKSSLIKLVDLESNEVLKTLKGHHDDWIRTCDSDEDFLISSGNSRKIIV